LFHVDKWVDPEVEAEAEDEGPPEPILYPQKFWKYCSSQGL
nr:hypothetical protein [Tanacetum cinerariifolium]